MVHDLKTASLLLPCAGDAPAPRPAAGEDPAKRRQILEGASRVFSAQGFDAASMNDVVKASGVSKSTLYVYFRSKEDLFSCLVSEERERYFAEIQKLFDDPSRPAETLAAFGRRVTAKLTSRKVLQAIRTVIGVAERMPEVGRGFHAEGMQRGARLLADYLDRATRAGTLAVEDPQRAAFQFTELAMAGLFRPRLFGGVTQEPTEAEIDAAVDSAVRLFMAGYGPKP
jgi:AcrR family transcriptional regulator